MFWRVPSSSNAAMSAWSSVGKASVFSAIGGLSEADRLADEDDVDAGDKFLMDPGDHTDETPFSLSAHLRELHWRSRGVRHVYTRIEHQQKAPLIVSIDLRDIAFTCRLA